MSVIAYDLADLFVVTVIKRHASNVNLVWANNYELYANSSGDTAKLVAAAGTIVAFEKALHHTYVQFLNARVSTWTPDSKPYNPEAFINLPLTGNGAVTPAGDPAGLNVTLSVVRQVSTGKLGHLFFRGVLAESQVSSPAGVFALTDKSAMDTFLQAAIDSSSLDDIMVDGAAGGLEMVMVTKEGSATRNVTDLVVKGITTLPLNHAWFNRPPPAPPS